MALAKRRPAAQKEVKRYAERFRSVRVHGASIRGRHRT
jgi:hypothetical protein